MPADAPVAPAPDQTPPRRSGRGGRAFVGVSGWRYAGWRGNLYPPGLAQARELEYASRQFNSIELNGSFYSLQRPSSYALWAAQTPPGFVFSVKGGRYITHMLRLRNASHALGNFFASGLFALGEKLGPVLWQFPANFSFDPALFEAFLGSLPHDTTEAARVARGRDDRLRGRELLDPPVAMRLRHAVEVRHASFANPDFMAMLRRHRVAWVVANTPLPWPQFEDVTSDFVYMRLHGATELYNSHYSAAEIARWAGCIQAWRRGRQPSDARLVCPEPPRIEAPLDVYCYFDNTDKLHAPVNARELMQALGIDWNPPGAAAPQTAAAPRR